ncbi:MAG: phage portal protein [Magnetococcales bacterium]|nr:phage portal protein [Magnetococcales bacterium]
MNFIDRLVSAISPEAGLRRLRARHFMGRIEAYAGGNHYHGANRRDKAMRGKRASNADADTALSGDLEELRNQSNRLIRNEPLATGAIRTAVNSVIGPGLRLQSNINRRLVGLDADQAEAWQRKAEDLFTVWANSTDCDITKTNTFAGLQALVFRSKLVSGDCFSLLSDRAGGHPFDLAVQVVEGHRVSTPRGEKDGPQLNQGVEKDQHGAPVAYHVSTMHPGSAHNRNKADWVRIPVRQASRRVMLHHYQQLRPGQTRGEPFLSPVIYAFSQLGDYTKAELEAAVVSAFYTVFLKSEELEADELADGIKQTADAEAKAAGLDVGNNEVHLKRGGVTVLGPEESIEIANPGRPNALFDPFVNAIIMQIGAGLGIPQEVLTKSFKASYSAAKAALQEAWQVFNTWRHWMADSFCRPVYEAFITEQVLTGRLYAPGFLTDPIVRRGYLGSTWIGSPMPQLDPLKEAQAAEKRMDVLKLTTHAEESAALTCLHPLSTTTVTTQGKRIGTHAG